MHKLYKNYILIMLTLTSSLLLIVLFFSYWLTDINLQTVKLTSQSVDWQKKTNGIVRPPDINDGYKLFKFLSLNEKQNINTMILGSSTVLGITEDMLPAPMKAYNFAQHSHKIAQSIGEAQYFAKDSAIRWLVIGLDWYLGYLYFPTALEEFNPSVDQLAKHPLLTKMDDALSLPRLKNLFSVLKESAHSPQKLDTLKLFFKSPFQSAVYSCSKGELAKDFDINLRYQCAGLRADGSATFGGFPLLTETSKNKLIHSMLQPGSVYLNRFFIPFNRAKGIPNAEFLSELSTLAKTYRGKQGGVILILPPLAPGYEKLLLSHPLTSSYLLKTKQILQEWGAKQKILIIDAGQSEKFNCTPNEFFDEHHAVKACYEKIFSKVRGRFVILSPSASFGANI